MRVADEAWQAEQEQALERREAQALEQREAQEALEEQRADRAQELARNLEAADGWGGVVGRPSPRLPDRGPTPGVTVALSAVPCLRVAAGGAQGLGSLAHQLACAGLVSVGVELREGAAPRGQCESVSCRHSSAACSASGVSRARRALSERDCPPPRRQGALWVGECCRTTRGVALERMPIGQSVSRT